MSTRAVVVGVDGSAESEAALRLGLAEARRLGAPVRLVHVVPDFVPLAPALPLAPVDLAEASAEILQEAAEHARTIAPDLILDVELLHGPVSHALATVSHEARLLVLGRDDRSMLDRVILGDTSAGVSSRASCPVLTVPSTWQPEPRHGSVLVGVKSAQHSMELFVDAFGVAAASGARVTVLHAWSLPRGYARLGHSQRVVDEWAERSAETLEEMLSAWRISYPDVEVEVCAVHGAPVEVLKEASQEADVLVLVRRGHGLPAPTHLGTTARALLREASCPVRVVPPGHLEAVPGLVLERAGAMTR